MPDCACYLRVSTDDQTVENQRAEVSRLVQARGFVVREYAETGSAVKTRPVFESLLADVRAGRVQAVAVWSLDRLGRGFACFDTFRELARLNVRVLSAREPWLDAEGPTRDLLAAVMSWVSGFERQRLIERTRAGLARVARENRDRTGPSKKKDPSAKGWPVGRPPTSRVLLAAALDLVRAGMPVAAAARAKGVSRRALQRHMRRNGFAATAVKTQAKRGPGPTASRSA